MKKVFLFLLLSYTLIAQTTSNLSLYTGDYTTFQFLLTENLSTYKLLFVVKANNNIYSDRLIEKKNNVYGGDTSQIKVETYISGSRSTNRYRAIVKIQGSDTDTLMAEYYYYDLVKIDPIDSTKQTTLFTGTIQFKHQVESPYDNTYVDERAVFKIASGTIQNETIIWDIPSQTWMPSGDTGSVGGSGVLPDSVIFTSELLPYVDKTSTETISGQKEFSNTKTVFSGDSVNIRTRLRIGNVTNPFKIYLSGTETYLDGPAEITFTAGTHMTLSANMYGEIRLGGTVGTNNIQFLTSTGTARWTINPYGHLLVGDGVQAYNDNAYDIGTSALRPRVIYTNSLSSLSATIGNVSNTEIGYLDNVSSSIQTQLNGKQATMGSNDNYVSDAQLIVIGNTLGINTGDNATNSQYSGLAASKQNVLVSGSNIRTVNGNTLLGSTNLVISATTDTNVVKNIIDQFMADSAYQSIYTGDSTDALLTLAGTAIQSSALNTLAEFDTQIGITGTASSSTYWRGDNSWSALPTIIDTLTYTFAIIDTTITGAIPGWKVPFDITIVEIAAYTEANTVTFNLEERAETTPNTAGTDVIGSDLVADNNQEETSTFTNASIAKNAWLVPTISATGDVEIFSVTVRYVKVY